MGWEPQSTEGKLRLRVTFLESQLRSSHRLATEASALLLENTELRRRQHWLEKRNNELTTRLSAIEQASEAVEA